MSVIFKSWFCFFKKSLSLFLSLFALTNLGFFFPSYFFIFLFFFTTYLIYHFGYILWLLAISCVFFDFRFYILCDLFWFILSSKTAKERLLSQSLSFSLCRMTFLYSLGYSFCFSSVLDFLFFWIPCFASV